MLVAFDLFSPNEHAYVLNKSVCFVLGVSTLSPRWDRQSHRVDRCDVTPSSSGDTDGDERSR